MDWVRKGEGRAPDERGSRRQAYEDQKGVCRRLVRFYGDETSGVEIRLIGFATDQCSGPQPLAARLSQVRRTACIYWNFGAESSVRGSKR